MPISEETKKILQGKGREDLIEIMEINDSGYAGVMPNGNIVDRRKHPEAVPVQENKMMGIPKSTPVEEDDKEDEEEGETWDYCPSCSGSGEGPADGTRCWRCKGLGEIRLS